MSEILVWRLTDVITQRNINVYKSKLIVGRSKGADITCMSAAASRSHAEFTLGDNGKLLMVTDLNSMNGTFVNKEKIPTGIPRILNEGDEVGVGIDWGTKVIGHNMLFKVGKITARDVITLDSSDDENANDKVVILSSESVCDNLEFNNIDQNDKSPKLNNEEVKNQNLPAKQNADEENNVQNGRISANTSVQEKISSLSTDIEEIEDVSIKSKVEPLHCLDEELIIIIDDDDDDDTGMLSQVLAVQEQNVNEQSLSKTDDIFDKIKKELEELDKVDCQEWQYPFTIDSDNENFSEIFEEELKEYNNTVNQNFAPPSPKETIHVSCSKELHNKTTSLLPLPSSATNGDVITSSVCHKSKNTVLIEPQPLKIINKKRKLDTITKDVSNKRRRSSCSVKSTRNVPQEPINRKRKSEKKVKDNVVNKEQKKKIVQVRKGKLKEIAIKQAESKSLENKAKISKPKVKVSEGRGNFLLSNIDAVPSTSKAKDINHQKATANYTPKKEISKERQSNSIIQRTLHKKTINVDTSDEVTEILSWNTNWLTKNENLKYLNPVVTIKKLKPLEDNYSSYHEYFDMNRSLLMVELWAHIQKEFEVNRSNSVFSLYLEDCKLDNKTNLWRLSCIAYLTKTEVQALAGVKETDLIVMDLRLVDNEKVLLKPCFGFIENCSRCVLRNHHYINATLAQKLPEAPHTKLTIKVLVNKCTRGVKLKSVLNFKIITSLVSHLRLFKSLRYLEHSPLIDFVLKPSTMDFKLPEVATETLISKDALTGIQLHTVMEAVHVCSRPKPGLYLLQGPPGTGKTNVIKNIVLQLLYGKHKIKNGCILLVAPSNAAVDQLVLKLVNESRPKLTDEQKKNMKLLRVGPANSIHENARPYCLEYIARKNLKKELLMISAEAAKRHQLLMGEIEKLEAEIQTLKAQNKNFNQLKVKLDVLKIQNDNFAKELLRDRYNQEFLKHCDTMLCGANIICTTLSSCMGKRIEDSVLSGKLKFVCCIVDEATQSTEQETLIPLRLDIKRIVLVGDPKQLPATVMSPDAKALGYGCSLFQRILNNFSNSRTKPVRMLNRQYRMHPEICKFPNEQYYGGRLESATFKYRKPLQTLNPFLIFSLNCSHNNNRKQEKNDIEAYFVYKLIETLLNTLPSTVTVSIGIITPYQNQRITILNLLKSVTYRKNIFIDCNTVDSFQGQETDIIILSCVREAANTFLNDGHRLNVALTRARYALYVVGTKSLFDSCVALAKLRENAEERKLVKDGTHLNCEDLKVILWKNREKLRQEN